MHLKPNVYKKDNVDQSKPLHQDNADHSLVVCFCLAHVHQPIKHTSLLIAIKYKSRHYQ